MLINTYFVSGKVLEDYQACISLLIEAEGRLRRVRKYAFVDPSWDFSFKQKAYQQQTKIRAAILAIF